MRVMRWVLAMAAGSMVLSSSARASCWCMGGPDVGNSQRPWAGREVVFTGYAIHVEDFIDSARTMRRRNVLFVTEESWRGAVPDTVSLFIDAYTCEFYSAGFRYLVTANWDKLRPGRLVRRACDYS